MRNLFRICLLTFSMLVLAAAVASADPVLKQYRAAMMQWYPKIITGNRLSNPYVIAFDGSHIWVTNYTDPAGSLSVFNASDGSPATSFGTNGVITGNGLSDPDGIAFDGNHVWVPNYNNPGSVSVFNASDGTPAKSFGNNGNITGLNNPMGIAFDGTNMWVTNGGYGVTRIPVLQY